VALPRSFSAVDTRSFEQGAQQHRPSSTQGERNRLCTAVTPWRSCRIKKTILSAWFEAQKPFTGPHQPGLGLDLLTGCGTASPGWKQKQWKRSLLHVTPIADRSVPQVLRTSSGCCLSRAGQRQSSAGRPGKSPLAALGMPWRVLLRESKAAPRPEEGFQSSPPGPTASGQLRTRLVQFQCPMNKVCLIWSGIWTGWMFGVALAQPAAAV